MKGKLELIRIMEATKHNRRIFINLERDFAELDEKHPIRTKNKEVKQG